MFLHPVETRSAAIIGGTYLSLSDEPFAVIYCDAINHITVAPKFNTHFCGAIVLIGTSHDKMGSV